MNEREFVREIVTILECLQLPYFITGGMAAIAYGEPRYTSDVDIVVDLRETDLLPFLARFPGPEYYVSEPAARHAVAKRLQFNILHPSSGSKVDVMVPTAGEYDRLRLSRKIQLELESDLRPFFASPEDVILKKLEYYQIGGSDKHLRDIASMVTIQADKLDQGYLALWAGKLGVTMEWELILQRLREPDTEAG